MGILFAVIVIGGSLIVALVMAANNTIKYNQGKIANEQTRLQENYGDGDYHITLPDLHTIGIAWDRKLVVIRDSAVEGDAMPFANIRSADIELDNVSITTTTTTTSTNRGSQLAGGLIGGAALGPAGMIVGGLSGGSTSKAKGIGRKQICLVRLIVRVRDRANPVRSITLYEDKYGEGDEADGPFAGPAITAAQRFHALLTQIVEDEATQRPEAPLPVMPS